MQQYFFFWHYLFRKTTEVATENGRGACGWDGWVGGLGVVGVSSISEFLCRVGVFTVVLPTFVLVSRIQIT